MTIVVAGPSKASSDIARGIAEAMGSRMVTVESKRFPDGESYVRIPEDLGGEDVIVVHTMASPQDRSVMELAMLVDAARGLGASRVIAVAPYTAYSRQDTRFLPGEPVSIAVVLKLLYASGSTGFATVEIHKEHSLRHYPGKAVNVRPYTFMARSIGLGGDILVLAPDQGALPRAEGLARSIDAEYDYLVKHRDRVTGEVVIEPKNIDVNGREVLIVDDIISTGGTIAKAAKSLLSMGAKRVNVMVAHLLGIPGSIERIASSGVERIYAAYTLPRVDDPRVSYIDVSSLIAGEVSRGFKL
ncbi:MAG: ribose-phosphate pyrophosphokinase [Desulfurococcales archaeon]|nr:ribose-phosphate pyrophosphokinase [Desulfurococcales archaeon]